ncbi:3-hydroxyacyl-CoA dehydrogenase/enoyl-CoA hydratase family protein [Arhodomonas aquaeolei]|uniref:3-hydroxyacyl-CoA dehydrogenase/enoyl-CoA hydratase family protein n=1 Tax=Arhodomonas aquaeolei TaxID=2369 RepID=UPI00036A15BA|nr:3-hydroxyacyl-CoA dehydrogenase/enoyl-CoA hydratase family protein [Arhodomonas aquaeolei]
MSEAISVRRAAVLGAGVMGAQIAAHLANAGIPTVLFELAGDGDDRRSGAREAIRRLGNLQPAPLASPAYAERIRPANYEDDLAALADCDLVIEAVAERLDVKLDLFRRVAPHLPAGAVVGSNTSGLSVEALAEALPEALHGRFCGIHFFNPPRYMHLVELIPTARTEPAVVDGLEAFLTTALGKGVIRGRDTPNFVGNRIGVFAVVAAMAHAERLGLAPDVVDALTGPAIGRPRSATFRTADLVGLDTLRHVVEGNVPRLQDDPWVDYLRLPDWMVRLIEAGALGRKAGAGVYRKGREGIEVVDPVQGDYRTAPGEIDPAVSEILAESDPAARLRALRASEHPQAEFLWAIHRDTFHYAAHLLGTIADNARDVDLAIRWGFAWQQGPFETWQAAGWQETAEAIDADREAGRTLADVPLPDWVFAIEAAHTPAGAWSPGAGDYRPPSGLAVYRRQYFPPALLGGPHPPRGETVLDHPGVRLWHLEGDVGVLSFRGPKHAVGRDVLDGVMEAVEAAEGRYDALVLWQPSAPFSVGANLKEVSGALEAGDFDTLERMVRRFQQATARVRDASIPVVAGARGMALGGGCEFLMHCDHVVAALESYVGLVEAGVGLIPAGGGCRALARHAAATAVDGDPFPAIQRRFETVARAEVAASAVEAVDYGFLPAHTTVVPHEDEVLHVAIQHARALAAGAYRPPLVPPVRVAGRDGLATLEAMIVNLRDGGFISGHDARVAHLAARALTGGEVDTGSSVDDSWLLELEVDGFMTLLRSEATQARIAHMLRTGKPLRN